MRAPATSPDEPEPTPLGDLGVRIVTSEAVPPGRLLALIVPPLPDVFNPRQHAVMVTGIEP